MEAANGNGVGGPSGQLIGRRMVRVEDGPLLRGQGRFVDDLPMPDALHVAFLRSPVAHGRLKSIDVGAAKAHPGVHAVLTFADLRPLLTSDRIPQSLPSGAIRFHVDPQALVKDEATYVGEPIAMVIAQSRRLAEDALTSIAFDIEPLPAVTDPVDGLESGAPKARLDCPDNLVARQSIDYGDIDGAFAKAAHRIKDRFRLHKGGGHSIETRGIAVRPDPIDETLTIYANTQMPHRAKQILVAALGLPESRIRVVAPDSGGGFGPKAAFHPEELALPAAALLLGKPLKWMEDRRENFIAAVGERDQDWDMEAAFDADGRLLALRGRLCHDHGSCTPYGVAMAYNAGTNVIGPYVLPAYRLDINWCLTNFVPSAPTRGAGRPQGMFVMERMLDAIALKLDLPRDEVRRRNMIQPSQMPYPTPIKQRDGSTMTYDSGDYPECQRRALDAAGWADFPARQAAARREGRYIGLGLANYVEATGRGPFESATLRVGASGKIIVTSGASAQGQGTKSMLAQLVGDVLNIAPESITIVAGDTAGTAMGFGAFASRQAVTAGNAVHRAAVEVREKAFKAAAEMLEASADDLELKDGAVQVKGVPQLRKTLAEIAHAIGGVPGFGLPNGVTPGLASAVDFPAPALTYCNGSHVCEAEADPETGAVTLLNYVVVHDSGRIINPLIVDGQVIGAVAHGIGATLYEWMRFDGEGQPQTVTYGDYLLPSTDTVPRIEVVHMETPTPLNPLGVKGAAESGTISAPAAIISAVEDALRPFNVRIRDLPLTPERLLKAIRSEDSTPLWADRLRRCRMTKTSDGVESVMLRMVLALVAAWAACCCAADTAPAQTYPQRTVKFILPFGPGSGADITMRLFSDKLAMRWGKPVVVENRPGGDGLIAINAFISANDDHTLLYVPGGTFAVHPFTHEKLTYDADRDLIPVANVSTLVLSAASPASLKANTLREFVDLARAEPNRHNAAAAPGNADFLLSGLLKTENLEVAKVPYRDIMQGPGDLSEGRIQLLMSSLAIVMPLRQAGRVKVLAVTSRKRASIAPDVPTVAEAGFPAMTMESISGVFAPRGMTTETREKIAADIRAVAESDPTIAQRLETTGQVLDVQGPQQFAASIKELRDKLASIAKLVGMKPTQ